MAELPENPRLRSMPARDLPRLEEEIAKAKKRFHLPADAPVRSCYEAGRDGFWLHRHLVANGVDNGVVDSASIEVNRRQRRAKTDRLDARPSSEACQALVDLALEAGGKDNVTVVLGRYCFR
jgi:transposase